MYFSGQLDLWSGNYRSGSWLMAGSGLGGDLGNVKSIFFHTFYHPTGPKAKCHQSNQRKGDRDHRHVPDVPNVSSNLA